MHVCIGIAVVNDGARLYVCEGKRERLIFLQRGDVFIFRGDFMHAGAEYEEGHFGRLHCYVDSPNVIYDSNSTDPGKCMLPSRIQPPRITSHDSSDDTK